MNKHWALTLREKGFAGVTFSKRSDVKFALRPVPYYEVDGDLEILEEIKNGLFKYGINSTITEAKYFNSLHVTGVSNCIVLSEILNINDNWANSLRDDFQKGTHLTEKGIKKLFFEFGKKSLLTYGDVCEIIDAAKGKRLDDVLQRVMSKQKKLTKLPEYDDLYKQINFDTKPCINCGKYGTKIHFLGKYPREGKFFFLCDSCIAIINESDKQKNNKVKRRLGHLMHRSLARKTGKIEELLRTNLCEVCNKNIAAYVYGIGSSNSKEDNVSLCQECRDRWYDMRLLYRAESQLEDIIDEILYNKFHEYPYTKKRVGKLIPDFVFEEHHKIIEAFGCYWHACPIHFPDRQIAEYSTCEYKSKYFGERGYETLFIWGHEFGDIDAIIGRINLFLRS